MIYFTSTEINNGLTVPSRVKELVAIMQKQSDSAVKNVGEASRQWSAVGSAISATENQECLDLFVHLDGLYFISKWLKDAMKFSADSSDSFLEESIVHLLQALGKLPVDSEKLVAADLLTTLNDLVHKSSKVKDEAKVLIDNWKNKRGVDEFLSHDETLGAITDHMGKIGHSEYSQKDDSVSKETSYKEKKQESTTDDPMLSASSDIVHSGGLGQVFNEVLHHSVEDNTPSNHDSSPSLLNPEKKLPSCHSADAISVQSYNPAVSGEDTHDGLLEFQKLESANDIMHSPKIESLSDKSGSIEELNSSEPYPASSDVAVATQSVIEPSPQVLCDTGNKSLSDEGSLCVDSRKTDSDGKCSINRSSETQCRNSSETTEEGGEYRTLYKSLGAEKGVGDATDLGASQSRIDGIGKIRKFDLHVRGGDLVNDYKFAQREMRREPDRAYGKTDVELYGIIDPLEVARQVAREVEREVVDYKEQSCSSSDKLPEDNSQQLGTPDSMCGKYSRSSDGSRNNVVNSPDYSGEASLKQKESATSTENLNAEQTNGTQDMETSQVTEAAQEECNTERGPCSFDLNEEVCSEDADCSAVKLMTPVSVVSASRAAAPPELPVSPLQFEGNLGWKGSAATSAFRPASPRRLPENEKDISTGGNYTDSKQQPRCLDIDLNVAEMIDGAAGDPLPNNNFPLCSSLLPGEFSVVKNSRISEPLYLDLNLSSEDGARLPDGQVGKVFSHANGYHNWSHLSPSSSKQPSSKNFDLNDRPLFHNDQSDNYYVSKFSQSCNAGGGIRSDESVISILGTRVEVSREEFVSPALPSGQTREFSFNMGRTGSFMGPGSMLPFAHSSVYSGNNILPGSAMPLSSSAMYGSVGPIPYVMDSRGPPVAPNIFSTPSAGFSQMPLFINMNPTSSSGVGSVMPSWNSLDLNSGTLVEGGGLNGRSMGEQLRLNTQLSMSSAVNGKRKEAENGLEQYPPRHYTPPWK